MTDLNPMRYKNKVVCITGASRGIGRYLAEQFANEGADIAFTYLRKHTEAQTVGNLIEKKGRQVLIQKANMGEPEEMEQFFNQIKERWGRIDVFIHNAASGRNRPIMDLDKKGWDWTVNVNTRGFLLATQQAVNLMPEQGGSVLALTSIGSNRVLPYYASVGATKSAIEALVRYFAVELASKNIVVNAISAGAVETGALEHFPNIEQTWEKVLERIPARRMVTSKDIARLALFLCSPEADMIRGQTICIDGGLTLPVF